MTKEAIRRTHSAGMPAEHMPTNRVIWRPDLQHKLEVSSNTILRWMKSGRLPEPDVNLSRKTKGWLLSTLEEAGIRLE